MVITPPVKGSNLFVVKFPSSQPLVGGAVTYFWCRDQDLILIGKIGRRNGCFHG